MAIACTLALPAETNSPRRLEVQIGRLPSVCDSHSPMMPDTGAPEEASLVLLKHTYSDDPVDGDVATALTRLLRLLRGTEARSEKGMQEAHGKSPEGNQLRFRFRSFYTSTVTTAHP